MTSCVGGVVVDSCTPGTPALGDGFCDGVDDDCDGAADENFLGMLTSCGVGACAATGVTSCVAGTIVDSCTPGSPAASDATCDGIDDDCNGVTDEDFVGTPISCGVGACAATGTTLCTPGGIVNDCTPGTPAPSDASCDGADDDCDGVADEDFPSAPTSCGVGACAASGATSCVAGAIVDSCTPGAPGPNDAVCNAIDEDCDGVADEDFPSSGTSCGVGACAATGATSCVAGTVVDSCSPGTPAPSDTTCDLVDDDCDGVADESFPSAPTSCGVGACAAIGATACVSGTVVDSCTPGTPSPTDAVCDAVDEDCDGLTDEGFVNSATSCGVGACAATGLTSCVGGAILDSCTPGTPAPSDPVCDGLDEDCDGATDEDFAPAATSCGVGACAASGVTNCVGGVLQDSCMPGTPTLDDSCDSVDQDCDGAVDEAFPSAGTMCGIGACAAIGATSCVSGAVVDSCTPGTPAPSDPTPDGVDDDCDGVIDEDVCVPTTCAAEGFECGPLDDGCGATLDCGTCTPPEVCAGAGTAGTCEVPRDWAPTFRVNKGRDAASYMNGARIIAGTPVFPGSACEQDDLLGKRAWALCTYASESSAADKFLVARLSGQDLQVIERIVFEGFTSVFADMTISVSDRAAFNPADLVPVISGVPAGALDVTIPPTRARFIEIRWTSTSATPWFVNFGRLFAFTRDRQGGILSLAEGGAIIRAVSSETFSHPASHLLTFDPSNWWQATTATNAWVEVMLSSDSFPVSSVLMGGPTSTFVGSAARNFRLSTSSTGAPGSFTQVLAGELVQPQNRVLSWFDFSTTATELVRVDVIDGHSAGGIAMSGLEVYSEHLGGATIALDEITESPTRNFVDFLWTFGDGNFSNARHPVHTYAAPGTYEVRLTVTDDMAVSATTSKFYTVLQPPTPQFSTDPAVPVEGTPLQLFDESIMAVGVTAVDREWSFAGYTGPPDANPAVVAEPSSATFDVTLRVTDSQLLTEELTAPVTVQNLPPTVIAGPDRTPVWGEEITLGDTSATSVFDPGPDDRPGVQCLWDFDDGVTEVVVGCHGDGNAGVTHTWTAPGLFDARLSATDPDGDTGSDTLTVTVERRPVHAIVERALPSSLPGHMDVFIRLLDAFELGVLLGGRDVDITSGGVTQRVMTDADGIATATFPITPRVDTDVDVAFLGDPLYAPGSGTATFWVETMGDAPIKIMEPTGGHEGRRFVLAFPQNSTNRDTDGDGTQLAALLHMSSREPTVATVRVPGLSFEIVVAVVPGITTMVQLPDAVRLGGPGFRDVTLSLSGIIEDKGIEVEAADPVGVYGLDQILATTDGYLGLPTNQLGTEYVALAYPNEKVRFFATNGGTQLTIVATEFGTTNVTIVPSVDVSPGPDLPAGIQAGVATTVPLSALQALQIANQGDVTAPSVWEDLSGTVITADRPIAVFGGHACAPVTFGPCDHLLEQLPPSNQLGRRFLTAPLASRFGGDAFQLVATVDSTTVRLDGATIANLDRGDVHWFSLPSERFSMVESTSPILLAQYSKGATADGTTADPFMMLVPPVEQYLASYVYATPEDEPQVFHNFVNLTVRSEDAGGVRVDGVAPTETWHAVGTSGYAAMQLQVSTGTHRVDHVRGNVPIGTMVYGFNGFDSYGYPAGMRMQPPACVRTRATPGDGVDNDCDGRADEELGDGIDNDGDGLLDEDPALGEVAVNLPPTARDMSVRVARDTSASFSLIGEDPNGDLLEFSVGTPPTAGTAAVTGRTLTYDASPGFTIPNTQTMTVVAFDGVLSSSPATITIESFNAPLPGTFNTRPEITTNRGFFVDITGGATSALLVDRIDAFDVDRDPITFTATVAPAGLTMNSATGEFTWLATRSDVGVHSFRVEANDGGRQGPAVFQRSITVTYDGSNAPPVITSTPEFFVHVDATYNYQVTAVDAEGQPLTFSLDTAPPGLSINPTTGLITGTFLPSELGEFPVIVRVTDALLASDTQSYSLLVFGAGPRISSDPVIVATQDVRYEYQAQAIHLNPAETFTWSLVTAPAGMSVNASTGLVSWTPTALDLGVHTVVLEVRDIAGLIDQQIYSITVRDRSLAPAIVSTPPLEGEVDQLYLYDAEATDPEPGDVLRFGLAVAPTGMTIDPASGVVQWIPDAAGSFPVELEVTDLAGNMDRQAFSIEVAPDLTAPAIELEASPERFAPGGSTTLTVTVRGDHDPTTVTLTVDGAPLTLDAALQAVFTTTVPGQHLAVATVTDRVGNPASVTVPLAVTDATDTTPPTVAITSPIDDEVMTYLHDVIGTATDANLLRYTLALRPTNGADFVQIHESFNAVVADVLGPLDTTQLENGYYELRLSAEDVNGATAEASVPIRMEGFAKVGIVQLSFVDMAFDMAGIPLGVVRNYDSRVKESRDFGFGWTLDIRQGHVQHNRPVGESFAIYSGDDPFELPCRRTFEQASHFTEVRLSDREWYTFQPILANLAPTAGSCTGDVFFQLVDGTRDGAALRIRGSNRVRSTPHVPTVDPNALAPSQLTHALDPTRLFDPAELQLVTGDGRIIDLSTELGITRISDANGNTVQINSNAIFHSAGRAIRIDRDVEGRIIAVRDPAGNAVRYQYDSAGDLVGVVDLLGGYTQHLYESAIAHHLTAIIDATGRRVAAIDYEASGRVLQVCNVDGDCTTNQYDLTARSQIARDPTFRPVTYSYDRRGNIESRTDALGNTTRWTYQNNRFGKDLVRTVTDPLGHLTRFAYQNGEVIERTDPHLPTDDPADFTTRWTRDPLTNNALSLTLPSSAQLTWIYSNGQPTSMADGSGNVIWSRSYNADGTTATESDRFNTHTYEYRLGDSEPHRTIEPDGSVSLASYDTVGNLVRLDSDGHSMRFLYDATGRETFADYDGGLTARLSYDVGATDWTSFETSAHGRLERRFTSTGRLGGWVRPDGTEMAFEYDGAGRLVRTTDALGNAAVRTYDAAGRLATQTDVATGTTVYAHDGAGRLTSVTDALGSTTTMSYTAAGRLETRTDARGQTWSFSYSPTTMTVNDPLSRTTVIERTPHGLPLETTYADGSRVSSTYFGTTLVDESDDLPLTTTDEMGRVRTYSYGVGGRLATASDVAGEVWVYDEPARDIEEITSPEGRVWRIERSDVGEVTRAVFPDGTQTVVTYDARNNPSTMTLPTGTLVTFGYDSVGRRTSRTTSTGESVLTTYGPIGEVELTRFRGHLPVFGRRSPHGKTQPTAVPG